MCRNSFYLNCHRLRNEEFSALRELLLLPYLNCQRPNFRLGKVSRDTRARGDTCLETRVYVNGSERERERDTGRGQQRVRDAPVPLPRVHRVPSSVLAYTCVPVSFAFFSLIPSCLQYHTCCCTTTSPHFDVFRSSSERVRSTKRGCCSLPGGVVFFARRFLLLAPFS